MDPSDAPITEAKREVLQVDPNRGSSKHPRHLGNLAERVSNTSMSSQTQGTPATSPDTGIGHGDDVVAVPLHIKLEVPLLAPMAAGVLAVAHAALVQEVNSLRDNLGQTQRTLDVVQAFLSTFETNQTRTEAQLDPLIRIQQPVAKPDSAAQAPLINFGRIPIRLKEDNVTWGVNAICAVS